MRVVRKHLLTIFGACGAAALAFFAYEVAGWIGVGVFGLMSLSSLCALRLSSVGLWGTRETPVSTHVP